MCRGTAGKTYHSYVRTRITAKSEKKRMLAGTRGNKKGSIDIPGSEAQRPSISVAAGLLGAGEAGEDKKTGFRILRQEDWSAQSFVAQDVRGAWSISTVHVGTD